MVAQVEDLIAVESIGSQRSPQPGHDIVHVGKVAPHVAMVEHLDGTSSQHGIGEQPHGHIRPPPGPIHRKEAQADRLHPIQVAIGMSHQFVGLLGGGIETDRGVHAVVLAERELGVTAIHTGTGGIDEPRPGLGVPADLEDVEEAFEVRLLVDERVVKAIAYASLGRQVADGSGTGFRNQIAKTGQVAQVHLHAAIARVTLEQRVALAFESDGVVVVEIVESDDRLTLFEEGARKMEPDEASGAGDEGGHGRAVLGGGASGQGMVGSGR